ncbi:hypothetical protein B0J11DRAFT_305130 [Dendryphion nanum]|uniref:Uncharacterized protein n=1 Tax=Dendryphion nanum TaxID=256645 RepID=A0A9P9DU96_9PLEO|nr:hypothetical protein B0J11DRAFT_305130 [Dendryphion nanum]
MPPTSIRAGRGETGASFVIWIRAGCCKDGPDGPGWMGWMGRIGQGNTNAGVCVHLGRGETRRKRKRERFFLSFSLSLLRAPSALSPYNVVTIQRAVLGFVPGYCIWVHSLGRLGSHSPKNQDFASNCIYTAPPYVSFRIQREPDRLDVDIAKRGKVLPLRAISSTTSAATTCLSCPYCTSTFSCRYSAHSTDYYCTCDRETITSIVYQISNSPNYTSRWTPHSIRSNLLFAICYLLSAICCLLRTYCLRSPPRNPTSPTKLYQQPPSPPFGHPPIQKPIQPIQRLIQAQLNFSATLVSS